MPSSAQHRTCMGTTPQTGFPFHSGLVRHPLVLPNRCPVVCHCPLPQPHRPPPSHFCFLSISQTQKPLPELSPLPGIFFFKSLHEGPLPNLQFWTQIPCPHSDLPWSLDLKQLLGYLWVNTRFLLVCWPFLIFLSTSAWQLSSVGSSALSAPRSYCSWRCQARNSVMPTE